MTSGALKQTFLLLHRLQTPVGWALIVTDENGTLRALDYEDYEARMHRLLRVHYRYVELRSASAPTQLWDRIHEYFAGSLTTIEAIVCDTNGTPFQRRVWKALRSIAPGTTTTYGTIARSFEMPNASRAVGLANGANPIAIIVPCHRVIGASGALTGYAGGLHRKQWLLNHEQLNSSGQQQARFPHQSVT